MAGVRGHLVLLEDAVDHERGLLVHALGDGVGHGVVGLEPPRQRLRHPVLVVHVLLGVSGPKNGEKSQNAAAGPENGKIQTPAAPGIC